MRVVIDTNILLQAIADKSRMRPIWNAYLGEYFNLIVTASILLEYEEKVAEKTSHVVTLNVISLINEAVNSVFINIYFNWHIILANPDDNKFLDAAITGNADYIVTNDAHFNAAKKINFPKVNIISSEKFLDILTK